MLGAAHGMPWAGMIVVPLVLALHLALSSDKKAETMLILSAGIVGFFVDTFPDFIYKQAS